jgi:hypothetical protein
MKKILFSLCLVYCLSGSVGSLLACPTPVYSPTNGPGISYKHNWNTSRKKSEKNKKGGAASDSSVANSGSSAANSERSVADSETTVEK